MSGTELKDKFKGHLSSLTVEQILGTSTDNVDEKQRILDILKIDQNISTILSQNTNSPIDLNVLKEFALIKLTDVVNNTNTNTIVNSAVDVLLKLTIKQKAAKLYIYLYHLKNLTSLQTHIKDIQNTQESASQACLLKDKALTTLSTEIEKLKAFVRESSAILDASSEIQGILDKQKNAKHET